MTQNKLSLAAIAMTAVLCGFAPQGIAGDLTTPPSSTKDAPDGGDNSAFLLSLQYTGEAWHNEGGMKDGSPYLQGVNVSLNVDLEKLGLRRGARFYLEGFYVAGDPLGDYAGGGPVSALDAISANDEVIRFYQAFYEQEINDTSVLVGFYDMQQHFMTLRPTEVFFNRNFALPASLATTGLLGGVSLPSSYPNSTLGLRVKHKFNDQWTAKIGVLNGVSDNPDVPWHNDLIMDGESGILGIGQLEYSPVAGTTFTAAYWNYTSKLASAELVGFARKEVYGADGFFFGANTRLWTIEGNRRVDGFLSWNGADISTSVVDTSESAGLTITGLFAERPTDKLGIGVTVSHLAEPFRDLIALGGGVLPETETAIEVTYRARINDWLTIQPDFQYIISPSIAPGLDDAFVFGIHFEIGRDFKF